jgi:hypothetical protein
MLALQAMVARAVVVVLLVTPATLVIPVLGEMEAPAALRVTLVIPAMQV